MYGEKGEVCIGWKEEVCIGEKEKVCIEVYVLEREEVCWNE